ncbi:MAG TPA: gamma-glutamyltransferase [Candidatus Sulfotelmatobacter sp.]|nr:gamma-glutamyltransferase [Candidatus Sulfotelmatobacter sp.]
MRSPKKSLILPLLLAWALAEPWASAAVHPVRAQHAMVVTVHQLATQVGVEIMQARGNAVDSAVAVGFALAVVHPPAGNIGGGGLMLIRMADGTTHFLDYREKAPATATRDMYLDEHGKVIEGASEIGYKSIAVPGSVAGLVYAEQKYGKLTLKEVMAPAIKLAREGYPLTWDEAEDLHDRYLAKFPESHRVFQRNGDYYKPGDTFRQPDLARTLERIAAHPDDFYHGGLAKELAAAIQKGGGLITAEDLASYEVKEREPVRGSYRGYQVISAPPPSSGGTVLIESLNILEGYDLDNMESRSARSIHFTVEAFRRAFFDRAEFLGDPDFSRIPVAQLVDKKYAAAWRETIDPVHASPSKELKRPAIFSRLEQDAALHPPLPPHESNHTTHYSVVDSDGNAVAVTTTINDWFGSRVTADGLGFLLNDEMDDFSAKPGVPNADGLIQGAANAIGPGKRPLSSMTPTIVVHGGKTVMVLGSPGSSKIITTVANVLMGVVDYGMNIQEAVNAPRFHNQWLPDVVNVEKWFSPDTLNTLRKMGYNVHIGLHEGDEVSPYWSDAECIAIDEKTGDRLGATDMRNSNGKAMGY